MKKETASTTKDQHKYRRYETKEACMAKPTGNNANLGEEWEGPTRGNKGGGAYT